jgi:hypothetical protein
MIRLLITVVILLCIVVIAPAQRRRAGSVAAPVRILREKPTVYITLVRRGKIADSGTGEVKERVWLWLHNNTRWSIKIQASGVPKEDGDAKLYYGIETIPRGIEYYVVSEEPVMPVIAPPLAAAQPTPSQSVPASPKAEELEDCEVSLRAGCHFCSVIPLHPGRSLTFSVPREDFCKRTRLYVPFSYSWEDAWPLDGQEPEHRVYFYGSDLLKEAK